MYVIFFRTFMSAPAGHTQSSLAGHYACSSSKDLCPHLPLLLPLLLPLPLPSQVPTPALRLQHTPGALAFPMCSLAGDMLILFILFSAQETLACLPQPSHIPVTPSLPQDSLLFPQCPAVKVTPQHPAVPLLFPWNSCPSHPG